MPVPSACPSCQVPMFPGHCGGCKSLSGPAARGSVYSGLPSPSQWPSIGTVDSTYAVRVMCKGLREPQRPCGNLLSFLPLQHAKGFRKCFPWPDFSSSSKQTQNLHPTLPRTRPSRESKWVCSTKRDDYFWKDKEYRKKWVNKWGCNGAQQVLVSNTYAVSSWSLSSPPVLCLALVLT